MPRRGLARTTTDFHAVAAHLEKYCGISKHLASVRLHRIKQLEGKHGDDNMIFDFCGGVYDPDADEDAKSVGILTEGGAKERS